MNPDSASVEVIGLGASGSHCARQLATSVAERDDVTLYLSDIDADRQSRVVSAVEGRAVEGRAVEGRAVAGRASSSSVAVVASAVGTHVEAATRLIEGGSHVVSISDDTEDVRALLALHELAVVHGVSVVVGAGFAPGVTDLLAALAARSVDVVDEIAMAKTGTGGPACARQHHRALKRPGHVLIDGDWVTRSGGSGRDLAWFPGSIGARDTYRADLPDPILLHRSFPDATRISARVSATRRDRLTSPFPMLRPPHDDGGPGGVRVEVRGRLDGAVTTIVYGVMDHPSVACATMAAVMALAALDAELPVGAFGLGELDDPRPFLLRLHQRGVKAARFEGVGSIA